MASQAGKKKKSGADAPERRLAFLISDSAADVLAVAGAIREGKLPGCSIAIVVCNIPGAEGAEATRAAGLMTVTMEGRGRGQRDHEEAIDALLRKMRVDLVCLSGYLRTLSGAFLRRWSGQVVNVHPSLLPAFPGSHAVSAALEFGSRVTGCTVFLSEEMGDAAVIVEQRAVLVEENDTEQTLGARIASESQAAFVDALGKLLGGEHEAVGRRYVRWVSSADAAPVDATPADDEPTGV